MATVTLGNKRTMGIRKTARPTPRMSGCATIRRSCSGCRVLRATNSLVRTAPPIPPTRSSSCTRWWRSSAATPPFARRCRRTRQLLGDADRPILRISPRSGLLATLPANSQEADTQEREGGGFGYGGRLDIKLELRLVSVSVGDRCEIIPDVVTGNGRSRKIKIESQKIVAEKLRRRNRRHIPADIAV